MKKRGISFAMALLLALQPTAAVAANSEESSVVRGEDYTIRTHVDGTKTLTFYADMEASDYAGGTVAEDENETGKARMKKARATFSNKENTETTQGTGQTEDQTEALSLETFIDGEGEDVEVTLSYG